jgi:hypothetical protein
VEKISPQGEPFTREVRVSLMNELKISVLGGHGGKPARVRFAYPLPGDARFYHQEAALLGMDAPPYLRP